MGREDVSNALDLLDIVLPVLRESGACRLVEAIDELVRDRF
jgi:hypothetical protein